MLTTGPAKKVSIYVSEDQHYHGNSTYAAVLEFLFYRGIAGATVTRGIAGFGADHHLHSTRLVDLTQNLPVKIEFVEAADKVDAILPRLHEMVGTGLIEVQDTTIVKPAGLEKQRAAEAPPALKLEGQAKLMRIYLGEGDRWGDKPLHMAIVEALRANDMAGVTVYTGILGYGASGRMCHDRTLTLPHIAGHGHDRPVMLTVIESEEKLQNFMPILEKMMDQGLVAISDVNVVTYRHNFLAEERRKAAR